MQPAARPSAFCLSGLLARTVLVGCALSAAAPRGPVRAQPPEPPLFNSGPTVYNVTLHGVVTDARGRPAPADSCQ